ncbi:hypothetical protein [Pseudosulfitobacter sp. SM2401]
MPKSKKPKAKRPATKQIDKPTWYQELNGAGGKQRARPVTAGKKSQNKPA